MSVFRVVPYQDTSALPSICRGKSCYNSVPKGVKYCEDCAQFKSKFPNLYPHSVSELVEDYFGAQSLFDRIEGGRNLHFATTIYFIRLHNFAKIGRTENVKRRLSELQIGVPYKLKVMARLEEAPLWLENKIHLYLQPHHVHGEWFKLSKPTVELVKIATNGKYEAVAKRLIKAGL